MLNSVSALNQSIPDAASAGAIGNPVSSYKNVFWFQPLGGTTLGTNLGGTMTGNTTLSTAITQGGANINRFRRSLSTTTAAINQPSGIYQSYARYARGSTGGFEAQFVFGVETHAAGHGVFCGMSTNTSALASADITALVNCVGVGFTAADAAGADWSIFHNDAAGVATKTPIAGMPRSSTTPYVLRISCPMGADANATVSVMNALTGAVILAPTLLTTDLPANNAALAPGIQGYTGASTTALVTSMASVYVETMY